MKEHTSVRFFKGVGPKRAEKLAHLGIQSLIDLLRHYPRQWEDRKETPQGKIPPQGEALILKARVMRAFSIPTRGGLAIFKAQLSAPSWGGGGV